jgi:uncharacterized protein (TIGR00266 family)
MQLQTRHNPAFTVGRLYLAPGEPARVESGAMMATSAGVKLDVSTGGGLLAGLKRSALAGESFFVTTYTAPPQGGWVDVAGVLPGDIIAIDIQPDRPFFVTKGCWIANSHGTEVTSKWGGGRNLFGGEGGFGLQATGQGQVVVSVYGALDVVDLQPGESIVVDTGHVVAYDLGIQFRLRRAVEGKTFASLTSGEGFVFDFFGPGRLLLQSRNPSALTAWIHQQAPSQNPTGSSMSIGGLGNLLGG